MSQRDDIKAYLVSIAPAAIKPVDLASILGIPESSCRSLVASLANTDGSGIHRVQGLGYQYGKPNMEELELQEMYWSERAVKAEKALVIAEELAYQALAKVDKHELRLKYQQEAIDALTKLMNLDNTKE